MKIRCLHGYFKFEERSPGQISDFMSYTGLELVAKDDHYTFSFLEDAKKYSIAGDTYLGVPVLKTFEGEPWEVMRENGLVFDFTLDKVVPIVSVIQPVQIDTAANYFVSNGMILPGSVRDDGKRVKDYAAFYLFDQIKFKYSEVSFE